MGCPKVGSSCTHSPTYASTHSCQYSAGTLSSFIRYTRPSTRLAGMPTARSSDTDNNECSVQSPFMVASTPVALSDDEP